MQPRVTAILVAPGGATHLDTTLDGLSRQTRPPEALVVVDTGGPGSAAGRLTLSGAAQLVQAPSARTFGAAVARAVAVLPPTESADDEWIWLLGVDNAPRPEALATMLSTVEVAPSVAVAGPKLLDLADPAVIVGYGETVTRYGASLPLVDGELDQGQHDVRDDVLAVAAGGMLVRRSAWTSLGGFDLGLPHVDAALDFCVRARLAGARVVLVPGARVLSGGPIEDFGRDAPLNHARRATVHRWAQLHRRLAWAPAAAVPLHWLSLVPLALVRSVWHLLVKNPGAVPGEFSAAFGTAFGRSHVLRARRSLRRTRTVGWSAIEPLRATLNQIRERRVTERDALVARVEDAPDPRASFLGSGGLWVVLVAAVVGVVAFFPLLRAAQLTGGGLLPLSTSLGELWSSVGWGWREIGTGFQGPSDPFALVVALLGTLTPWSPSFAVVLLWFVAMPLSALGAWFALRRLVRRTWIPAVGALIWSLSSPLASALQQGHLGAVVAHVLLPFLALALLGSATSWAAGAAASLLFAGVAAGSPSLLPALVVCWLGAIATRPRGTHRMLGVPLPALVLFLPVALVQASRGTWWAVFADPGVPVRHDPASGLQLLLGTPETGLHGWTALLAGLGVDGSLAAVLVGVAFVPLGLLAALAVFAAPVRRAAPPLVVALLGYVTAVAATHLAVTGVGSSSTSVWAGSGLSVYLAGLVGAAAVSLDRVPRVAPAAAALATVLAVAGVAPVLAATLLGEAPVRAGSGRILSAYVTAEAEASPDVGTLVVTPQPDGALAVSLERGQGTTLDDQSTLDSTAQRLSSTNRDLTELAGNLVSRSGFDPEPDLRRLGIGFVLLSDVRDAGEGEVLERRASEALDSDALFQPVGQTDNGLLWRYVDAVDEREERPAPGLLGVVVPLTWALVLGSAFLLALPTAPRRRRSRAGLPEAEQPATTFDEERDA